MVFPRKAWAVLLIVGTFSAPLAGAAGDLSQDHRISADSFLVRIASSKKKASKRG